MRVIRLIRGGDPFLAQFGPVTRDGVRSHPELEPILSEVSTSINGKQDGGVPLRRRLTAFRGEILRYLAPPQPIGSMPKLATFPPVFRASLVVSYDPRLDRVAYGPALLSASADQSS
jgi:hypothetical protein